VAQVLNVAIGGVKRSVAKLATAIPTPAGSIQDCARSDAEACAAMDTGKCNDAVFGSYMQENCPALCLLCKESARTRRRRGPAPVRSRHSPGSPAFAERAAAGKDRRASNDEAQALLLEYTCPVSAMDKTQLEESVARSVVASSKGAIRTGDINQTLCRFPCTGAADGRQQIRCSTRFGAFKVSAVKLRTLIADVMAAPALQVQFAGQSFKVPVVLDQSEAVLPTTVSATTTTSTATMTTTIAAAAATLPAGCAQLDSVVDGVTGAYKGSLITVVADVATLAGCAAECHTSANCIYFAVHGTRGCQLRKTRGVFYSTGAYNAGMGECTKTTTAAPTTTTVTTTTTTVALPGNCNVLKQFPVGILKRHAYQGKNYGAPEKGVRGNACAAKCAALPMCNYWISHVSKGCILKFWGLARKKVFNDVYEAHGFCEPDMDAKCRQLGASLSGDGYLAKRAFEEVKDGATTQSPGGCSQLCAKTAGCNYWIVHNTKGCFMHKETKAGKGLKEGWRKKGYMAHGVCNGYEPGL